MHFLAAPALPSLPARVPRPRRGPCGTRLTAQIEAGPGDAPGPGGWSGGFANHAHWDPGRSRDWRCWAQTGPTWSAHCGAEVAADDSLGLCRQHRLSLLEGDGAAGSDGSGAAAQGSGGRRVAALAVSAT